MKFSVIIPTYNRSDLLIETINSILDQTFQDYEVIIVNDGSTDNSKEVLESYGTRIRVIHKENSGAEKSRNAGAEIAKGEYFCFFDSDDLMFPWTLEVYSKVIEEEKFPPLVLGQPLHFTDKIPEKILNQRPDEINYVIYKDYFSKDRTVYSSSSMIVIKKENFYEIGKFRPYEPKGIFFLDDLDFMLRAGTISPAIIIYEPYQFAYRTHSGNSVKNLKRVIKSLNYLITEEQDGKFAGGDERKFERHAIIGGPTYFWLFRALRQGIIYDSIKFFLRGYPFIIKGLIKKIRNKFRQRVPAKTIRIGERKTK
jgi:glycosyltransferase involved in cell wall biosynthesis